MRSFFALQQVELGFNPSHILVARLPLPEDRYKTAAQLTGFFRPLLERLKTMPGVVDATETSTLPPYGGMRSKLHDTRKDRRRGWRTMFQLCSDGYFPTLGIKLKRGRTFTEAEMNNVRKVAVVNRTFVKKISPNADPIGQHFTLADLTTFPDPVHGPDIRNRGRGRGREKSGAAGSRDTGSVGSLYHHRRSAARGVLVRTSGDPRQMLNAVSRTVWSVDRGVALTFTDTAEHFINQFSLSQPRFGLYLLGVFAGVGLVLVTIGVYGVISYAVSRQTHEIGIRMAWERTAPPCCAWSCGGASPAAIGLPLASPPASCSPARSRASSSACRHTIRRPSPPWCCCFSSRAWRHVSSRRARPRGWIQ